MRLAWLVPACRPVSRFLIHGYQVLEIKAEQAALISMRCSGPCVVSVPCSHPSGPLGPLVNTAIWASTSHGFITDALCLCREREIFVIISYENQRLVPNTHVNELLSATVTAPGIWLGNVLVSNVEHMVCPPPLALPFTHSLTHSDSLAF